MSTNGIMMNASFRIEASAITSGEAAGGTKTEKNLKASFATMFFGSVSKLGTNNKLSDSMQTTQKTEYSEAVQKTDRSVSDAAQRSNTPAEPKVVMETKDRGTVKETDKAVEQVTDDDLTDSTENAVATGEAEPTEPELIEKVATLLNGLMNVISRILGIEPEDATEFMEENNILPTELTDPDVLRQMTLFFNNEASPLELITNEELEGIFKQVTDMVNSLVEEFNTELEAEGTFETGETIDAQTLLERPDVKEQMVIKHEDGSKTIVIKVRGEADEAEDEKAAKPVSKDLVKNFKVEEDEKEAPKAKADEVRVEKATESPGEESTGSRGEGSKADDQGKKDYNLFTQFTDKMVNVVAENEMVAENPLVYRTTEIISQLAEQIKINITPDHTSLEMMLNPESLGKISLGITSKNGVMTAELKVENQIAKEAIESQLITLKETIENQGIRVEAIEVTVSSFDFGQSKDGKPAQNEKQEEKKNRKTDSAAVADTEQAPTEVSHLRYAPDGNSTVNYVA